MIQSKLFIILFLLTGFFVKGLSSAPEKKDSIGAKIVENQYFIIHKVASQETLYAISRKYSVSVDNIVRFNPEARQGLKVNQILHIPSSLPTDEKKHIVKASETLYSISKQYNLKPKDIKKKNKLKNNKLSVGQVLIIPEDKEVKENQPAVVQYHNGKKLHTVEASQTLYAISKMYGASTEKLKEWNNLTHNDLKIGQQLIVGVEKTNGHGREIPKKPVIAPPEETYQTDFKKIEEKGLAEVIESTGENKKYLALHATAPIGTIIQIINDTNGLSVFVRVVGKLPNTGIKDKVLIKISKAAFERLGGVNKKFAVKISYLL